MIKLPPIQIPGIGPLEISKENPLPKHYRELLIEDYANRLWSAEGQETWPWDAMGNMFLGRAILRLGETMFPDDWTGYEPTVDMKIKALPENGVYLSVVNKLGHEDKFYALNLLDKTNPPRRTGWDHISSPEWAVATAARAKALALIEPARTRLRTVHHALQTAFVNSAIETRLQGKLGGDFSPVRKPTDWLGPIVARRLRYLVMNSVLPFSEKPSPENDRWVFLNGEQFEALRQSLAPAKKRGNKSIDDSAPLVTMKVLLESQEATSAWDAAGKVAAKHPGHNAVSTQRRIFEKFKELYPELVKQYG